MRIQIVVLLMIAGTATSSSAQSSGPNPGVVPPVSIYRPDFVPMTQRERLNAYLKGLVGPLPLLTNAMGAGINQWCDRPEEWEQGGSGYGKRFANGYARSLM